MPPTLDNIKGSLQIPQHINIKFPNLLIFDTGSSIVNVFLFLGFPWKIVLFLSIVCCFNTPIMYFSYCDKSDNKTLNMVAAWEYNSTSGYYYDQLTGIQYDPKSGFYYSDDLGKVLAELPVFSFLAF